MATYSIFQALDRAPAFESPRFPGWTLRMGYHPRGELRLVAIRKSDSKRLEFTEEWHGESYRDGFGEASGRLMDKLGMEFLDLVPLDSVPAQVHNKESGDV